MPEKEKRVIRAEHVVSSRISPVSGTVLIISAWAWRDKETGKLESEAAVKPVIGIESRITEHYSRYARSDNDWDIGQTTRQEAIACDFTLDGRDLEHGFIIVDDDGGTAPASTLDPYTFSDNTSWCALAFHSGLVDDKAVESAKAELLNEIIKRVEARERREQAKAAQKA